MHTTQITDTILMVRPANFGYNAETAGNNAFQTNDKSLSGKEINNRAQAEFDGFVATLREAGVVVIVVEDTNSPLKHDAVFPNNWFSTHEDGSVITYPMYAPMRRLERREDVVTQLIKDFGFDKHIRLEKRELSERFLEGTGSMILDRDNRIVYACRSIRTDEGLLDEFALWMGFEKVLFESYDMNGLPIYHTNVMMALGTNFCVICLDTITDAVQRREVTDMLTQTGKDIVSITREQMKAFAGNMLQVQGANEQTYLAMSSQAYNSLTSEQIEQLELHTKLLHSPLDTIESYGGGSARCMMAEVFKKA
ncbi:citrulline utilization hydrolase CtlX [Lewinella cohaerens]|uniref:citrulline utilization hydrolase CtlX n=1 Tax=Lewinella cohaerens TaxID=70995 RepID=UPI00035D96B8|nr:arginine deiminase-related protein [Lewinella cohaerens]